MTNRFRFIAGILLLISLLPNTALATSSESDPEVEILQYPSVERTWSSVDLIYESAYHDSQKMEEELRHIESVADEIVHVETIGQSYFDRNITSVRITNELSLVPKAKALVVSHHHGREQITVEIALRFIQRLVNGYGVDPLLTEYVDTQEIYILPTINPDALDAVVNDCNQLLRKNLRPFDNDGDGASGEDDVEDVDEDGYISRFFVYIKESPTEEPTLWDYDYLYYEGIDNDLDGTLNEDEIGLVDLNRNYPTYWDDGNDNPNASTYRGESPFSEPETQAFRDFAMNHSFAMAYSLHSGINSTILPSNETGNLFEPILYEQVFDDVYSLLPSSFTGAEYTDRLDAGMPGGWAEWMYKERDTLVPITFELYTNASVYEESSYVVTENNDTHMIREWKGLFGYFNPEKEFIDDLWNDVSPAFDYLLEMTPRLQLDINGISRVTEGGMNTSLLLQFTNPSPRISSIDPIVTRATNRTILDTIAEATANESILVSTTFPLEEDLHDGPITFDIGNDYVGYQRIIISIEGSTGGGFIPTNTLTLGTFAGVTILVIALAVYWYKR